MNMPIEAQVMAFPGALLLDGKVYYYATLDSDDITNEPPEVLHRTADHGPLYADFDELLHDLSDRGIHTVPGVFDVIDVDWAIRAVRHPRAPEDTDAILTAWNGLGDLLSASALPFRFNGRLSNRVYDKLFYSLNYPSTAQPGHHYVPKWRRREIGKLVRIVTAGATRIRTVVDSERHLAAERVNLWKDHTIEKDSNIARSDLMPR